MFLKVSLLTGEITTITGFSRTLLGLATAQQKAGDNEIVLSYDWEAKEWQKAVKESRVCLHCKRKMESKKMVGKCCY